MYALRFIYKNLDRYKSRFLSIFAVGLIDGALVFLIPVLLSEFTKGDLTKTNFAWLIALIVACYAASLVLQWVIRKWGESLGRQFGNHIRQKYFTYFAGLSSVDSRHSGFLLSLVNRVSDELAPMIQGIFWTVAGSISTISLFLFFMARESVFLAFVNFVILVVFVAVSVILSNKMVGRVKQMNTSRAKMLSLYSDSMSNIVTVKRLGIGKYSAHRIKDASDRNDHDVQKLQDFHAGRWLFLHSIFGVTYLSTLGFLLFQISQGAMSVSILILFVAAYSMVRGNIERLSEYFKELLEMRSYIESVGVESFAAEQTGGATPKTWHEIKMTDVKIRHVGSHNEISIPQFHLTKNDKVYIIGASGQGKSTLLGLLANSIKPDSGDIAIDDKSYGNISANFFSENIAYISQDAELFDLSLRENMKLGRNISDEKIMEMLEKFDMMSWFATLDAGLDTVLGEKGAKLSTGQRQRLNIIRGLLLDRDMVLLDEPTSNLDEATEKRVVEVLSEYLKERTVAVVTHRDAMQSICDRGYIMKSHALHEANQ